MGNFIYCFAQKINNEVIMKSDINIENYQNTLNFNKKEENIFMTFTTKSKDNSPLYEPKDIFINPLPEFVILKPKRSAKKVTYN